MTKFLATLFATSFIVLAAAPAIAASNEELCGPNGPEAYKRAGGYCEQLKAGSLAPANPQDDYNLVSVVIISE